MLKNEYMPPDEQKSREKEISDCVKGFKEGFHYMRNILFLMTIFYAGFYGNEYFTSDLQTTPKVKLYYSRTNDISKLRLEKDKIEGSICGTRENNKRLEKYISQLKKNIQETEEKLAKTTYTLNKDGKKEQDLYERIQEMEAERSELKNSKELKDYFATLKREGWYKIAYILGCLGVGACWIFLPKHIYSKLESWSIRLKERELDRRCSKKE